MNSDEQQNMERKLFDEFLKESRFDDAVCEKHRSELRVQVLNAFDRSQRDAKVHASKEVVPVVAGNRSASQVIGVVASIAACLLGVVTLIPVRDGDSSHCSVTEVRLENATTDPVFDAALAEVQALQVSVPPELFFYALAICQKEHEARQANANANQMRWLYESLLRSFPVNSSKG